MRTFLKITGPKTDLWLVKTVGIILAVIGLVLAFASRNHEVNLSIAFLGIGSSLGLAVVEFIFVAKRVISPVYLGDAFIELALLMWWGLEFYMTSNQI
jgi:hypothetical protein